MLQNYLKIGWRNLIKNKLFSLINISGMAISIASFLVIALFIYDELQFDRYIENAENKYRVYNEEFTEDGRNKLGAMVPPMVPPALKAEYPEVESYTRFLNLNSSVLFEVGETKMTETLGGYSDPTMFDMFSLQLTEGDRNTALRDPYTIAISQTLAKKYFGDKPALGETIEVDNQKFAINAVYTDFPVHSHLRLNYLMSMETLMREIPERMEKWGWRQFHTYLQLKDGTDEAEFEKKLRAFTERVIWPKIKEGGSWYIPNLMPIRDIHLYAADHAWDIAIKGNAQTVYILSASAIFILLIAILNFINLSTARAVSRVKEVGVRKVVGAYRTQLIYQFISESIIIALIALLIGGLITELLLPSLNTFTEKNIPTGVFLNPLMVLSVLAFAVVIGVAAGAYPAFYISGYTPALILSNRQSGRSGKILLRKGLVVLQFMLSFLLIIASLVVSDQHRYMRTMDMGFDKDNLVVIPLRDEMRNKLDAVKNSFMDHPNVLQASLGYGLPGQAYAGDGIKDLRTNKDWSISLLPVDHDYLKTLGLELIAGRDFSKDHPSDTTDAFILSEAGAKMLGHDNPADALEHEIGWPRWDNQLKMKRGKVIGIVKDFHLNSLKENLTPIIIHVYPFGYSTLALRIKGENVPETIAHFEKTWKQFNAEWPFEYKFLDDNFDQLYKGEEKLATLFSFFTGFSIFVACLGLFGLVVYSTTQRYKEISIRKVLGAPESQLVLGLGKSYLILIGIAFVIAIPFSYYAAEKWLENFPYRIEITPLLFIEAALFILVLSLLTVGIQSLKAARANPVNALKEQ